VPTIVVGKSAEPMRMAEPGGALTYTVRVDNTSSEDLTLSWLTDSAYGNLNGVGSCSVPQGITAGAAYGCTFQAHVAGKAGEHTSQATATAHDNEGNAVVESGTVTVTLTDVLPTIEVIKSADPTVLPEPGGTVAFSVRVENHSFETVTLYSLDDAPYGDLDGQGSCALPQPIAPLTHYGCTFEATVTGIAGDYVDTVTARARDDEGSIAQAEDGAVVSLISPGLRATVTADRKRAYIGETISYLYLVQNEGEVTLTEVGATDARLGPIGLGRTSLMPGQIATGTAAYEVQPADLPGPLISSVTVYAQRPAVGDISVAAGCAVQVRVPTYLPLLWHRYAVPSDVGPSGTADRQMPRGRTEVTGQGELPMRAGPRPRRDVVCLESVLQCSLVP
jgi:hypothetical protein